MRLLRLGDSRKLSLTQHDHDKIPPYAILSHTWGSTDDEVSFHDVKHDVGKDKAGYDKIMFCGERASKDDLKDFWVDTCCIDKRDYTELSEAITSMFRWYQKAAKCYVYLSDVSVLKHYRDGSICGWKDAFRKSRWFTRGWTLQELLAPPDVQFWSRDKHFLGTKETLKDLIHDITDIPTRALLGAPTSGFSTFERMRWAAQRETKKEEDKSYCLLGIFDVSLPILYGEGGDKANDRLLTEIERSQGPVRDAAHSNPGAEASRKDLLTSLAFDQMDSRHSTIKDAQRTTCEWLLHHPDYVAWNSTDIQSNGILWIAGKPGAGKSTLMKFALADARKNVAPDEIILSFFFNARGEELEKSTLGTYRALLAQLLSQAPDLQGVLNHIVDSSIRASQQTSRWKLDTLQTLLRETVRRLESRKLKVFIDALDECNEKQVRDMVDFLEDLGEFDSNGGLSICFASRHYPTIEVRHSSRLVLEEEQGHAEDLSKYIKRRLKAGKGKKFDDIRASVQQKANGVFMWVVLVVEILNEEFRRGRIFAVEKRLREIPTELSELFKDTLRRDRVNMDDLLLCLQWILFAKRPLSRQEFYFALEAGLHSSPEDGTQWQPQPWDPEEITDEDMNNFVLNSSKGLAELTKSKKAPTVQFIHESVRDFLLRDGGLQELWPNELVGNFAARSHDNLRKCCLNYLSAELLAAAGSSGQVTLPKAKSSHAKELRQQVTHQFPFLQYAKQGVLWHLEATFTQHQSTMLQAFPLQKWIHTHNLLELYDSCRYSDEVSLLYILAENNHSQLIKILGRHDVWTRLPRERYQFPVLAAFAGGHRDALQVLLGDDSAALFDDLLKDPGFGRASQCRSNEAPLEWAASSKNWTLVECLLMAQSCHLSSQTKDYVLSLAASHGTASVTRILLDAGARFTYMSLEFSERSLEFSEHYRNVVQMLLDSRLKPDSQGGRCGDAVYVASHAGHAKVLQMLLDVGADVHAQGGSYGNALQAASSTGNEKVVKMLLDAGAGANVQGGKLGNALQAASVNGNEKVVRMLLDAGADVNAQGGQFTNALQAASSRGHENVLQILLDAGADIWGERYATVFGRPRHRPATTARRIREETEAAEAAV